MITERVIQFHGLDALYNAEVEHVFGGREPLIFLKVEEVYPWVVARVEKF